MLRVEDAEAAVHAMMRSVGRNTVTVWQLAAPAGGHLSLDFVGARRDALITAAGGEQQIREIVKVRPRNEEELQELEYE